MATAITLDVGRMTTGGIRSRALALLHELRHQSGQTIKDRDDALEQLEQLVIELATRTTQERLF